jgi:hypothetical protein
LNSQYSGDIARIFPFLSRGPMSVSSSLCRYIGVAILTLLKTACESRCFLRASLTNFGSMLLPVELFLQEQNKPKYKGKSKQSQLEAFFAN